MIAVFCGDVEEVPQLLENGADVRRRKLNTMPMRYFLFSALFLCCSSPLLAQSESGVMVIGSATVGFRATDNEYGSPYLESGLGGWGWGGSVAGFGVRSRCIFGGEVSTVRTSKVLTGRLVSSQNEFHSPIPNQYKFQETFVSALVGATNTRNTIHYFGGGGLTVGEPKGEHFESNPSPPHWFVVTGGIDGVLRLSTHSHLVVGVRYSYVFSGDHFTYVGAGHHALRTNIGFGFGSK